MITTDQRTKPASTPKTGIFALLAGLLSSKGTGMSKTVAPALLLATLVTVGVLSLAPDAADAEIFHPFVSRITGAGTPAKEFRPAVIAVDDSSSVSAGDLYVVDEAHQQVVDKLNAAGGFECQITGLPGSMGAPPSECDSGNFTRKGVEGKSLAEGGISSITVDSATGDLYIALPAAGVVDEFGPEGAYLSQIKGLSFPIAVAVDAASGDVYIIQVAEEGSGVAKVSRYEPATATLTTFAEGIAPTEPFGRLGGLAVDNDSSSPSFGDVYVVDRGSNVVDKFNKTGGYEGQLSGTPEGPFLRVDGVAVDPSSGDVYVGDAGEQPNGGNTVKTGVDQFDASGAFLGRISGSQAPEFEGLPAAIRPNSIAIAPTGDVYSPGAGLAGVVDIFGPGVLVPDVKTEAVAAVTATTATAAGTVNAEGVALTSCEFEYGPTAAYGQSAVCEPAASSIAAEQAVTAHLIGLEGGTTYHFRLRAMNADGYPNFGKDETFTTSPIPSIDAVSVTGLGRESATLNASVNPHGLPLKECYFEYGTSTSYGLTAPCAPAPAYIPADSNEHTVSATLSGLEQATYHWRIVITDANGTPKASGYDHTFVYDTSGGGLPDGRGYEQVTPAHKNGALFGALATYGFPDEIANDGSRVIAETIQCFGEVESCTAESSNSIGMPYAFTRTSSGWQTTALAPPADRYPVSGTAGGYNANTGLALFVWHGEGSLESSFLLRGAEGSSTEIGPTSGGFGGEVLLHTEDYSHIVFQGSRQVFEYAGPASQPFAVGVRGGAQSPDLISACETRLGEDGGPGTISADGSTVYFTAIACQGSVPANELYARVDGEQADAKTVPISVRSPSDCAGGCATSTPADAEFWDASEDGSKVFFTSSQQLTNQAVPKQENLYEYDFDNPAGQSLLDVSAGEGPVVGGPRVQGVVAVSADGSHVYFIAQGVLTRNPNGQGQLAQEARNNLYVFERDGAHPAGRLAFVATLAGNESERVEWVPSTHDGHLANVTPDGRFLVFTSHGQLTADATSRGGARQVFRYDADPSPEEEAAHVPQLIRISIGNDGFNDNGNRSTPTPCDFQEECTEDASIVAPLLRPRRDPTMSDDGEYVFFESPVGLAPQALDDAPIGIENENAPEAQLHYHNTMYAQNVYEWHKGHVFLISDGRDVSKDQGQSQDCVIPSNSLSSVCLLGTDASGADVFFTTADALVPQDTDTELDIYDARIGGGFPAPAVSPPCLGEECHGIPPARSAVLTGGSATFNGQGNLAPAAPAVKKKTVKCKKSFVKNRKNRCVKRPKKKAKRAKKAGHGGRTRS